MSLDRMVEKDTLVIDTVGYNDKFWFDRRGHSPHRATAHDRTVDARSISAGWRTRSPSTTLAFTKPFTVTFTATLSPPGDELMEYICQENNQYGVHTIPGFNPLTGETKSEASATLIAQLAARWWRHRTLSVGPRRRRWPGQCRRDARISAADAARPVPRMPDGKPDLTGPWVGGGSNVDIERDGGLKPGELPLLPWARKLRDSRKTEDEPHTACLPMGVPRVNPLSVEVRDDLHVEGIDAHIRAA